MTRLRTRMTTVNGMVLNQPAGFWRRMFAGLLDILLLATAAMVLLLEVIVAVPVASSFGWIALDPPEMEAALWTVLGVVWYGTSVFLLPGLYYTLTEGA